MKKYSLAFVLLVTISLIFLVKNKKEYYKTTGLAQGTTYNVIYSTNKKIDLADSIGNILDWFDQSLSSYKPISVISKINNNENIKTDTLFNYVFELSKEIYQLTDGAFDITVAPLVNAWGFGRKNNVMPKKEKIDSILEFVGLEKVDLMNSEIIKDDPRIQLDVNAIAQGYSVDVIAAYLDQWGIKDYLVEVGGEVKSKGKNQNEVLWRVGVERPTENNDMDDRPLKAVVNLNNMSLATSGNYRKFYEKDGVKFVHTINPKTGQTIQSNLLSTSVLTSDCAKADALATAFMVLGLEKSKTLVQNLDDVDAYFIYSDVSGNFAEWATTGFEDVMESYE